ncbi:caspase family protein [Streptomyces sp. NPDC002920]
MNTSRHALIIANDRYDDQGLKQLRSPAQDAVSLARVLGDPEIGDFDVEVLRNERVDAIRRGIERFFSESRRDDTLMVHFSCHGLKSESGSLYFAARDTEPRLLEATAVSAGFVRHCMFHTRARRTVLFLDCCYGGAFSRGSSSVRGTGDVHVLESFGGERLGGGRGWAVITASNSMEYAFEGTELAPGTAPRPSVFTHAVVEGLTSGEADLDADGEVSLDELYDYVFDHVKRQNPHQTPGRSVEMQGDMYLAHSRRHRVVGRPVPPALRRAVEHSNFYTRLGAVAELRGWLESADLPKALGAHDALREIERDDIRVVSEEARRALADADIRPDPVLLDFGQVPQDSDAPHRPVHLLGPPLARACSPRPEPSADAWLRAEESPEGLDVGVDTSRAGRLRGDLLLKGPTGEATVHVEAEVVPAPVTPPEPATPPPPPPPPPPRTWPPEEHVPGTGPEGSTPGAGPARVPEVPLGVGPEQARRRSGSGRDLGSPTGKRPAADGPGMTTTSVRPGPAPRPAPSPHHEISVPPAPHEAPPTVAVPRHTPPTAPTAPRRETPAGSSPARSARTAPVLGALALVLAVASVGTVVLACVRGTRAARLRQSSTADLAQHVQDLGGLTPLVVSLGTAVAALVLCALTRHHLGTRLGQYTPAASATAKSLAWAANFLAIPALALGGLLLLGFLVADKFV